MLLVDLMTGTVSGILSVERERMFMVDSEGTITIAESTTIRGFTIQLDDDDLMDLLCYATDDNDALAA